jgi:hypothetical protein
MCVCVDMCVCVSLSLYLWAHGGGAREKRQQQQQQQGGRFSSAPAQVWRRTTPAYSRRLPSPVLSWTAILDCYTGLPLDCYCIAIVLLLYYYGIAPGLVLPGLTYTYCISLG